MSESFEDGDLNLCVYDVNGLGRFFVDVESSTDSILTLSGEVILEIAEHIKSEVRKTAPSSEYKQCFYCCDDKHIDLKAYGNVCCPECKRVL